MHRALVYISLFISSFSFSQEDNMMQYLEDFHIGFENMNYRNHFSGGPGFTRAKSNHGNVRPYLTLDFDVDSSKTLLVSKHFAGKTPKKWSHLRFYPLADLFGGVEIAQPTVPDYQAGLGFGFDFSSKKFNMTIKALPYYSSNGFVRDSFQQAYNMDVGTNRAITNNVFYRGEALLSYKANKFFTFTGGWGKNFFGDGYRSMLLSDNAGASPFLRIETKFAGINYVNLYTFWRDNSTNPFDYSQDIPKFASMHYLSWNVTKDFNISVFEAVVFQARDTLVNRGFDFNYINPIVFYRPVEYGLGSADNVLLGLSSNFKLDDHNCFYTQFVLDEFLLSEIRARSRWWANKYGWQFGYKSDQFFAENLYFQLEFNGARPYTYSHKSSQHAYGHMNVPLAHPLGANFMELVNITSYKNDKHRFTNKIVFASYGADNSDTVSYGQDIFASYELRPGEYDQLLFQGVRTNVFNETFIYEYELLPKIQMYLTAQYNWRMAYTAGQTNHFHTFSVGIRSRIWNAYSDL